MILRTLETYENETEMGEISLEVNGNNLFHVSICSVADGFKMKLDATCTNFMLARRMMWKNISTPFKVKTIGDEAIEETIEFIVRSFIENLDVEPYTINEMEAKEILENVRPDIKTTPEELASIWNTIVAEYMKEG